MIGRLLYTMLPVVGGGILHMVVVKAGWLRWLTRPLDGGRMWRGRRVLGDNKTWRGIVVILVGTILCTGLQRVAELLAPALPSWNLVDLAAIPWWRAGFWWGASYALAELPNSFLKRRFGILSGEGRRGVAGALLAIVDQADSAFGCCLAAWLALDVPAAAAGWMFLLGTGVHLLCNFLLGLTRLRERLI